MSDTKATATNPPAPTGSPDSSGKTKKTPKCDLYSHVLDSLQSAHKWARGKDGMLYRYEGGRYISDCQHGSFLSRLVVQRMRAFGADLIHEDEFFVKIQNHLIRSSPELWERPPDSKVCLRDGILDLEEMVLHPHGSWWLSPVQLGTKWNPEAKGPGWEKFLGTLFQANHLDFVSEVVGSCLTPDRSVQSALWFKGTGSNGKSTLLMAIEKMIGRENTLSFNIADLDRSIFTAAEFYGKLLAVDYDTKDFNLENSQTFKKIISGDPIMAQRKFGQPFQFEAPCKTVYLGNSLPHSKDRSFGFARRFIIVPMLRRFEPGAEGFEAQQDILWRLGEEEEKSWLLGMAARGWKRLRQKGAFSSPEPVVLATEKFRMRQHPFGMWSETHLTRVTSGMVEKDHILAEANEWLEDSGHATVEMNQLAKLMHTLYPTLGETNRDGRKMWTGVEMM